MWNNKYILLFNTVKYLKFKQIFYRIFYFIRNKLGVKPKLKKLNKTIHPINWKTAIIYPNSYLGNNEFIFLNIKHTFQKNIDWNFNKYGKLWTYNLNYFDFLNQQKISKETGLYLINEYISKNNTLKDGLEPYTISLRIINWIKFIAKNNINNPNINQTIFNHLQILTKNLEYHLLGNHLLENGFALLFGSIYLNDKNYKKKALKIIKSQLKEQILNDGAHFELSPMYHKILLHRLLDCINLIEQNKQSMNSLDTNFLKKYAIKMLSWLEMITFKNGEIPMFNDSAYGIAATSKQLFNYAEKLNLSWKKGTTKNSNYYKFEKNTFELVVDYAAIGPRYQPGHAHADTFTFSLHNKNVPIIIDPAISTYNIGESRSKERATAYHNTVTVNDQNSSQVWSGFRVAKRAKVTLISKDENSINGKHNGFSNLKITHQREIRCKKNAIAIIDKLNKPCNAKAYLHFHPNCKLIFNKQNKSLKVNELLITFENAKDIILKEYNFATGFNTLKIAKKIEIHFNQKLITKIDFIAACKKN